MNQRIALLLWLMAGAAPASADVVQVGDVAAGDPTIAEAVASGGQMAFMAGMQAEAIGVTYAEGTCAHESAVVGVKLGEVAQGQSFADGYWPTMFASDKAAYGCLDLRDGYLAVIVTGGADRTPFAPVFAEIRRAAYAKYGAPLTTDVDPIVLPHSQQSVSGGGAAWKVVDGARDGVPGGDVLLTDAPLGAGHTLYGVGVAEGACAPGTSVADSTAAALFPSRIGAVWIDTDPDKLRWKAWACVTEGATTATISVLAPLAGDAPPPADQAPIVSAMVAAIARSYGVDTSPPVDDGGGGGGGHRHRDARLVAIAAGYVGVVSFAPSMGDRRSGGLVGFNVRLDQARGVGFAGAFDLELGYGGGELIGEMRTGGGLAFGSSVVLDGVAGISLGSIGPAAAMDGYVEAGLNVPAGRGRMWFGALHAVGLAGPDHSQLEARLHVPGKADNGFYASVRYLRFGQTASDGDVPAMDNGSAIIVTFGGGASTRD